jgi:hypothetical protein
MKSAITRVSLSLALGLGLVVGARTAEAHCDTLSGPVITAARRALDTGDPNLALIWVQPNDEAVIRERFAQAVAARKGNGSEKEAADRSFFETLVRIHRAGEGAPYTGLKPSNTDVGVAVPAADRALESGTTTELQKLMSDAVQSGIQRHFQEVLDRRKYGESDVQAGRAFVKAYVEYTHFVEGLYGMATSTPSHEEGRNHELHAHHGDTHAESGHGGHREHLPWLLSGVLGVGLIGQTGWLFLRRKSRPSG